MEEGGVALDFRDKGLHEKQGPNKKKHKEVEEKEVEEEKTNEDEEVEVGRSICCE